MRAGRYSIAALMAVVSWCAVGFAALGRPSRLWAAVLFSGATAALTVAAVGALVARGPRRAFCIGAAAGGWMYLLLQYGPFCEAQVGPHTLPTALIDLLYGAIHTRTSQTFTITPSPAMPGGTVIFDAGSGQLQNVWGSSFVASSVVINNTPNAPNPWAAWTAIDTGGGWAGLGTPASFFRIAHSLLALMVALVVGLIARRLARRPEGAPPPEAKP